MPLHPPSIHPWPGQTSQPLPSKLDPVPCSAPLPRPCPCLPLPASLLALPLPVPPVQAGLPLQLLPNEDADLADSGSVFVAGGADGIKLTDVKKALADAGIGWRGGGRGTGKRGMGAAQEVHVAKGRGGARGAHVFRISCCLCVFILNILVNIQLFTFISWCLSVFLFSPACLLVPSCSPCPWSPRVLLVQGPPPRAGFRGL